MQAPFADSSHWVSHGAFESGDGMLRLQLRSHPSMSFIFGTCLNGSSVLFLVSYEAIALGNLGVDFQIVMVSELSPSIRALMAVTHEYLQTQPLYAPEDAWETRRSV